MCLTKTMSNDDVKNTIMTTLKCVQREGIEELMGFLEKSDFFTAPASTRFHGSVPGGLARHSLNVYYRLFELVQNERQNHGLFCQHPDSMDERATPIPDAISESIILIGLLHDICKTACYKVSTRNVKNDATGQWEKVPYYQFDDPLPYGHGEKSVYIISGFLRLTRQEAMAIRWHMGAWDSAVQGGDRSLDKVFDTYPLALLTHIADEMATRLDEVAGE